MTTARKLSLAWSICALLLGLVSSLRMFPVTSAGVKCPVLSPGKTAFVQCFCKEKKAASKVQPQLLNFVALKAGSGMVIPALPLLAKSPRHGSVPAMALTFWFDIPTPPPCA